MELAPREPNERENDAKVLLSTGTTMNSVAQAERVEASETSWNVFPVRSSLT